jgi:hypothetical protein
VISWCAPIDPVSGTVICNVSSIDYDYGGLQCGGKEVIGGGEITNPAAPLEIRINAPLDCYGDNESANQVAVGNIDEIGSYPPRQFYYYRTPNSPSSTPLQITGGRLCLKFNPYNIPDRFMVISGRNRYKYGGYGIDPSAGTAPSFWDQTGVGATGIKQAETALGRSWPAANSVLNLPLFGADTSQNPSAPSAPCSDGACSDPSCFSVRANTGTGHYGTGSLGNGKGYYSFQCFNPQSYFDEGGLKTVPTCSVWSLVQSIWWSAWQLVGDEANFRSDYPTLASAFNNLLNADPSQTVNDKSNVRYHLENFSTQLSNDLGTTFIIPNVFLWDKDAYVAAGSNPNKWKHIYVVGNGNVLFDTQCQEGLGTPGGSPNRFGFVVYLDEVSHDPTYGSTGNARALAFFGCNANQSNATSVSYIEMSTMDCVNPPNNPKTGDPTSDCEMCSNEGEVDIVINDCVYFGLSPLHCSYNWELDNP